MKGTKPQLRQSSAPVGILPAPAWMTAAARAEWGRVMPDLSERRILTTADLGTLESYCICAGRVRDLETLIQAGPDADLAMKLMRLQDKAMASARQHAAELGLTPVSRSRPAIRDDADEDEKTPNPLDMG